MERCSLGLNMLEMNDCKHFRYNEIKKGSGEKKLHKLKITECKIGIGGKYGCPKYCPLYETD